MYPPGCAEAILGMSVAKQVGDWPSIAIGPFAGKPSATSKNPQPKGHRRMNGITFTAVGTILASLSIAAPQEPIVEPQIPIVELVDSDSGVAELVEKSKKDKRAEEITYKIFGRVNFDASWISGDGIAYDTDDGAEVRRARLGVKGTLYDLFDYKMEYELSGSEAEIKDLALSTQIGLGTLEFGHFKEPFSIEELTSSRFTTFIERALPNVFAPGRNLGIQLSDDTTDQNGMTWAIGLFRETDDGGIGNGENSPDDEQDSEYSLTARVTAAPIDKGDRLLHLGVAYSYRQGDNGSFRFRTRPEAHLTRALASTGRIDAHEAHILGLEFAAERGDTGMQAEYTQVAVDGDGERDTDYGGWYVQAHWWATGEPGAKNYKGSSAAYGRPKVSNAVTRDDWQAGAVQIAARVSSLDLSDGPDGDNLRNMTLGINWWLNSHTRTSINYVRSDFDGEGGIGDEADFLLFRFQIDF